MRVTGFYSIQFYLILSLFFNPALLFRCAPAKVSDQNLTHIIFREDFEGKEPFKDAYNLEVGSWDYALQYVTQPVYRGKKAARFEIRKDQPMVKHSKRAEVTIIKGIPSNNMWYSFAVYFPSVGFETDTEREVINQWYQGGTPATSLRVRNDMIYLETGPTQDQRNQFNVAPATKDRWHEFVFHFIHANDGSGLIEIWHDGKKVLTHKGGNMYKDVLPKWKIGIYKAAFKFGSSERTQRVAYFDNVKVGNEKATYEEMIPSIN